MPFFCPWSFNSFPSHSEKPKTFHWPARPCLICFLPQSYLISYCFLTLPTLLTVLQPYWPPCCSFSVPNCPVSEPLHILLFLLIHLFPQVSAWLTPSLTSFKYLLKYLHRKAFLDSLYKITLLSSLSTLWAWHSLTVLPYFIFLHGNEYYILTCLRVYDACPHCLNCIKVPRGQRPSFVHCYIPSI